MSDFKDMRVGDCVRLNSGGPMMTVESLLPGGEGVACVWFRLASSMLSSAGHDLLTYGEAQRINLPTGAVTKMGV